MAQKKLLLHVVNPDQIYRHGFIGNWCCCLVMLSPLLGAGLTIRDRGIRPSLRRSIATAAIQKKNSEARQILCFEYLCWIASLRSQ